MSETKTLRIERTFQAPAERVFDAWTSEEVLRRWWQTEIGYETSQAEVDLRVGGAVRVAMRDPAKDEEYAGGGVYTEVDRPHRLAFTWLWDGDTRRTLIEIDFAEHDGATHVVFTHRDLWDEEAVRDHRDGWTKMFDNLERLLQS
ncbi:MAG TPA: SRPBCC domain-containing protein [Solirubrobacteraceae bacterium]